MAVQTLTNVSHIGLGEILRLQKLTVPPNQREYSWSEKEVTTLFQDFASAMNDGGGEYFLGTIVVVAKGENTFEIVDGQQRLATTAIFLSAMRNYLKSIKEDVIAQTIDREYLCASSSNMRDVEPRIQLNLADNHFFSCLITDATPCEKPTKTSHQLIKEAFDCATTHVKNIVATLDQKRHGDRLVEWIKFLRYSAQVVQLTISSDGNAYRMFETLNDRGLKTTQADLVKNYLFGRAGQRLDEAQERWATMRGALEALDEDRVPTVMYLRHALMLKQGYFRENVLHDNVQVVAKGESQVVTLLTFLEECATVYTALFNPQSDQWNDYPQTMRSAIRTVDLLNISGLRPLMLAVAIKFAPKEAAAAFEKFISWSVRFLIAGSTLTGGYIEVPLAAAAKKVFDGEIDTEKALSKELLPRLPNNDQFHKAFANATVSKPALARYYLRALEMVVQDQPEPSFIPNDDPESINLEHILPQKLLAHWPSFDDAEVKSYCKRIGNLALLQAKKNADLKSASFEDKKPIFKASTYQLTNQLATVESWTTDQIVNRQEILAQWALKAWPL